MSLNVYLEAPRVVEVFEHNMTHNLGHMAEKAGLYEALWRPEEIEGFGGSAVELVPILLEGLAKLKADPEHFRQFEPDNGWGKYENLVDFVEAYLDACQANPDATVRVSR
jgi:hypothetical protein